jgi:voltage-gated potassium channel
MNKTTLLLLLPTVLTCAGTAGYWLLEPGWTLFDGLYMTVITLTTVGYGEIPAPLTTSGRILTILLLLGGVFNVFFVANEIIRGIVSGEYHHFWKERQMESQLAHLNKHVIVVGYGRMGQQICQSLIARRHPFVVIDKDASRLNSLNGNECPIIHGDGGNEDVLNKAGIDRAGALVAATGSDADNLFVVMSARLLAPTVKILARADHAANETKMLRAGANQVIRPFVVGGSIMADLILKPNVFEFLQFATGSNAETNDFLLEEIIVMKGSDFDGAHLHPSQIRARLGVAIVAFRRGTGPMQFVPPDKTEVQAGDVLIALGSRASLTALEQQTTVPET